MKNYELLCILPGTMTEEEVMSQVEEAKKLIEEKGGTNIVHQDKGKSRLAYPIRHIRYGYFHLIQFEAETSVIDPLRKVLNLNRELLRSIITAYDPVRRAERDKQFTGRIKTISTFSSIHDRPAQPTRIEDGGATGMKNIPAAPVKSAAKPAPVEKAKETKEDEIASNVEDEEKTAEVEDMEELKSEEKKEEIKIDDIDKKLDELLEKDLDKI